MKTLYRGCLLSLCLSLPLASQADSDAQAAIDHLRGSVANAELSLSIIEADTALREIRGQEALSQLAASVASAELAITLADASEAIGHVSDRQMLAELDTLMTTEPRAERAKLIMAVVKERPMMAAAVQESALEAGFTETQVASIVFGGLSDLPATAAGQ